MLTHSVDQKAAAAVLQVAAANALYAAQTENVADTSGK